MTELSLLQERVVRDILKHSKDGVAPSTVKCKSLNDRARKYFSSWEEACKVAGVKTVKEVGVIREGRKQSNFERNFYTERLMIALHMAGTTRGIRGQKDIAGNCIELARAGVFDEYRIV
jgi:hypothetical protein